jgi:hypothetical protein
MAETAGSASPNTVPPHVDPQSFFEIERLRKQVFDLQCDLARMSNAHTVAMNEREYWFKKWNALYEQHRAK